MTSSGTQNRWLSMSFCSRADPRASPGRYLTAALLASLAGCHEPSVRPPAALPTSPAAPAAVRAREDNSAPPAYFTELVARAQKDSRFEGKPLVRMELPPSLQNLDYDAYRTIRFRPERALWHGEPGRFEVQFFHVGLHYFEPLRISVLEAGKLTPVSFSPDLFSYDGVTPPPPDAHLGFAGFRVHTSINAPDRRDEFLVFQGASYFRAIARDELYGLSGRGLAIDTGEPAPEEFPRFTEFVLVRPGADDDFLWVLAFLESPRATGAYAFKVTPGETTRIEVTARVFLRAPVKVLGVAPLTSMFLYGEEAPARFPGDHPAIKRPEAHDSDGLASWSRQGEWFFRPLRNPPRTHVSMYRLDSPRGFGLLQRDRNPDSYRDPDYGYERRPSAWVEPIGDWGKGSLRLLEIATPLESDDNIGAQWIPDAVPGDGLRLHYVVHVGSELPPGVPGPASQNVSTRFQEVAPGRVRFTLDFAGPALKAALSSPLEAAVTAAGGQVSEPTIALDNGAGRCTLSFEVKREGSGSVDLRAFLRSGKDVLSETWSYLLPES
jgi:glucans biosynthesis protein